MQRADWEDVKLLIQLLERQRRKKVGRPLTIGERTAIEDEALDLDPAQLPARLQKAREEAEVIGYDFIYRPPQTDSTVPFVPLPQVDPPAPPEGTPGDDHHGFRFDPSPSSVPASLTPGFSAPLPQSYAARQFLSGPDGTLTWFGTDPNAYPISPDQAAADPAGSASSFFVLPFDEVASK